MAVVAVCLPLGLRAGGAPAAPTQGEALLVDLDEAIREARRPAVIDGVPDHSPEAVHGRRRALEDLDRRLEAIDPAAWPLGDRIDFLLVRARLDGADFEHRVVRPWARDPGFWVDLVRRTPYAEVPGDDRAATTLRERLGAIPPTLAAARAWLSEPSAELAGMAVRQLSRSDGVNQGEPRRSVPPEGVIGWYRDLIDRLAEVDAELLPAARAALEAVEEFRDWLTTEQASMTEPAAVGLDEYDWYVRHVLLMPYDHRDVETLGERELARARAFLAIERHRNRGLPEIEPARSAEEHSARVEAAEALIRAFLDEHDLLTSPDDLPPRFETDAYWIVRPGGKRHFWEEITYRDPLNNHIHASIPGHRFDALIQEHQERQVRAAYRDGVRAEGWAFYIEEMFLQAGLLDGRPRAKELFYIAQLKRAARIHAELAMQRGDWSLQQAIDYLVAEVPLMEPDLARYDLEIYLRRPTYGMNYVMGKVQLEKLLADRTRQLRDAFDLGAFHDEFLAAGPIPISLIRWQMTGLDDEVAALR